MGENMFDTELTSQRRDMHRKYTVSEREWQQRTAERYLLVVVQRAESNFLTNYRTGAIR